MTPGPPVGATPEEPRCDFRHSWEDCPHKPVGATDSPDEKVCEICQGTGPLPSCGICHGTGRATQPQPTDARQLVIDAIFDHGCPRIERHAGIAADGALKALKDAGFAIVDRKLLEQLRDCYGDEFVDHLEAGCT